jgi:hypothetical protein
LIALAGGEQGPRGFLAKARARREIAVVGLTVVGSLQNENGINISRRRGADIFDGTNSRWRLGVAPCLEALIDLPRFFPTRSRHASREITHVQDPRRAAS